MYLADAYSCDLSSPRWRFKSSMCTPPGGVAYVLIPLFTAILFGYLLSCLDTAGHGKTTIPGSELFVPLAGLFGLVFPLLVELGFLEFVGYLGIYRFFFASYPPSFGYLYICINSMQLLFVLLYFARCSCLRRMGYVRWFA